MYLALIATIPIAISLIPIPWYSFDLSLLIIIVAPVYFIFMLITLKFVRKDIIAYGGRLRKRTARTGFFILAVVPIAVLIIAPGTISGFIFTGLDFSVFIFWGASSITNFIAAFLYKEPKKNQPTS
jgi:hypothetical protein